MRCVKSESPGNIKRVVLDDDLCLSVSEVCEVFKSAVVEHIIDLVSTRLEILSFKILKLTTIFEKVK